MKNKDFRKAFTPVELSGEKKQAMLREIYRKRKQKRRRQMVAAAAGILLLLTSFLLLQDFLDRGGQDSLQGEEDPDSETQEEKEDPTQDPEPEEEVVEEDPKEDPEEEYISLEIPPDPGGMGDEIYRVKDLSELEAKLKNRPHRGMKVSELQEHSVDALPVFINPVTPGMNDPEQVEEFTAILEKAAKKMDRDILEIDGPSMVLENGFHLFMNMNLSVAVSVDEPADEITKDSLSEKSIEEALKIHQEYYFPMVSDLLTYENPESRIRYEVDDDGWLRSAVEYLEASEDPMDRFFETQFNQTEFRYSERNYERGDLLETPRINIPYYHLEPFEVLDELPLRSLEDIVKDRRDQEFYQQELKIENIVMAEVFYYTHPTTDYFPPIYRLYVEIENPEETFDLEDPEQRVIVPLEVLAVSPEYQKSP